MIIIRKVVKKDIPTVKQLLLETWIDTYRLILPEYVISKLTSVWHDPKRLEAEANNENIIFQVAVDNGEIIGLITITKSDGDTADLLRLYVHPDRQRRGIGKILLEQSLAELRQYKKLRVEVEEDNEKGKGFYNKHGFKEVGKKVENLENVEIKTIIMEKEL